MKRAVITLGLGLLLAGCQTAAPENAEIGETTEPEQQSLENGQDYQNIAAAVAAGQSMKCVYTMEDGVVATGYIKQNKYRGEAPAAGKKANVIVEENCTYTWVEGESQGVQMCVTPSAETEEVAEGDTAVFEADNAGLPEGGVKCAPEEVDDAVFNLPQDVKFSDVSAQMEQLKKMMPSLDISEMPEAVEGGAEGE